MFMWEWRSIKPNELSTSIIRNGILVVSDAISFVIHELRFFSCPTDLHDSRGDDCRLIKPNASVNTESTSNGLKGKGITSSSESIGWDLKVLRDIIGVEKGVKVTSINHFVGHLTILLSNCVWEEKTMFEKDQIHFSSEFLLKMCRMTKRKEIKFTGKQINPFYFSQFCLHKTIWFLHYFQVLTQVIERPFCTEADLFFSVVLFFSPRFEFDQRMHRHQVKLLIYHTLVFTWKW